MLKFIFIINLLTISHTYAGMKKIDGTPEINLKLNQIESLNIDMYLKKKYSKKKQKKSSDMVSLNLICTKKAKKYNCKALDVNQVTQ